MKRIACVFLAACIVLWSLPALAQTPLGFGYINTDRTNVRENPNDDIVTRLDDGDAVYILSQTRDSRDILWYKINTEYNGDRALTAWVQADYVTAGSALFSDIVQVAAGEMGMLALRRDGTVTGVANENWNSRAFRDTIAEWRDVRQVACGFMTYIALLADGSLRGFGNMAYEDWNSVRGVRLLDAVDMNIAYITQDGSFNRAVNNQTVTLGEPLDWQRARQIVAWDNGAVALYADGGATLVYFPRLGSIEPYQGFADWNDMLAVDCGDYSYPIQGASGDYLYPLLVGLHMNGTVSTLPETLFAEADAWTGIVDVKAGWDFIIGLHADGTAVAAGGDDELRRQVAEWTDVTAIDASMGYCVGIQDEGTLVFAGAYEF